MTNQNTENTISFHYTNAKGETHPVENLHIENHQTQNQDLLLTGLTSEGEYRSYKYSRMENIVLANGKPVKTPKTKKTINNDEWSKEIRKALKLTT